MARLHEAGRFLPSCEGGWSRAGIGGFLLKQNSNDFGRQKELLDNDYCDSDLVHIDKHDNLTKTETNYEISDIVMVDWESILFHEKHAAQLGCLEAMIVMAHYYLGLPTQLLLDCPIKVS